MYGNCGPVHCVTAYAALFLPSSHPLPASSLQLEEASSRSVRLQSQVESLEEAAKDKEEASRGQQ